MIILRKMTADEYRRFKEYSIADYAKDLITGKGLNKVQALNAAKEEFEKALPDGPETEGQFVMTIDDAQRGKAVGQIWFFYDHNDIQQVWLCDFLIYEEDRRKGYAKAALTEMERMAKTDGCTASALYVWDHNLPGYSLYQKCGYVTAAHETGGSVMKKNL